MAEEIDFYRTQTGLPFGLSVQDYEYEYFKNLSGLSTGLAIDDYKRKVFEATTGYPSQVDGEYWYYASLLGLSEPKISLEDMKKQFFDMH